MYIFRKVGLLVLVPLLALVILGAASIGSLKRIDNNVQTLNQDIVPSLKILAVMQRDFGVMHAVLYRHGLSPDSVKQADAEKRIQEFRKTILEGLDSYDRNFAVNVSKREAVKNARAAFSAYTDMADRVIQLGNGHDLAAVRLMMESEATPKRTAVHNSLTKIFEQHANEAKELSVQSESTYRSALYMIVGASAIMILVVSAMGYFVGISIIRPITSLSSSMVATAQSLDFSHRLTSSGEDEIAQALRAYETLLERLRNSFGEIRNSVESMHISSRNMSKGVGETARGSEIQSESAASMAASIEQLTVTVNHIAERAGDSHNFAAASGELATKGAGVILSTVEEMKEIAATVQETSERLDELRHLTQSITSVLSVIKEVADQTNLLALNAAIEAARAGEQGRGFAVVADEVRKLAERTANSTKEIGSMLAQVQNSAASVSESMAGAVQKVKEGVDSAHDASQAIREIQGSTELLVGMINEISDSVREQGTASNHIAQQVELIAQMAEENAAASNISATEATQLDELAASIKDALAAYRI